LIIVHVIRKPISEGTVVQNVLRWGCGAINVDGSRLSFASAADASKHAQYWDRDVNPDVNSSPIHTWNGAIGNHPGAKRLTGGGPRQTGGRWPPNLVLSHAPGCTENGTRKVKGSRVETPCVSDNMRGGYGGKGLSGHRPARGHGDPDGTERIICWNCEDNCPVQDLDAPHEETGGPSRYFKQVRD